MPYLKITSRNAYQQVEKTIGRKPDCLIDFSKLWKGDQYVYRITDDEWIVLCLKFVEIQPRWASSVKLIKKIPEKLMESWT